MSVLDAEQPGGAPLLPSFEALRDAREPASPSEDTRRILWLLNGPRATSIWVEEDPKNPDSCEPYFRQSPDGEATSWHPDIPLTEPKVSFVTVQITDMEYMEHMEHRWLKMHTGHVNLTATEDEYDNEFEYGPLSDEDSDAESDGEWEWRGHYLLMCCGIGRPRRKSVSIEVKPSASSGRDFVTLHDYLTTVHPWLLGHREDILASMGMADEDPPLPTETSLVMSFSSLDWLTFYEETDWTKRLGPLPHRAESQVLGKNPGSS